jgi:Xaa-Pro dipeptidase
VKKRIQTIFTTIEKPPDAIIIKNAVQPFIDDTFFYVTGLETGIFENSYALLYPNGDSDLLVPDLEAETARKTDAAIHVYKSKEDRDTRINELVSSFKKIGINCTGILHRDFCTLKDTCPRATFVDVSKELTKIRLVKDERELTTIQQSCTIADAVMKQLPTILHEGMHEYEIAAEINYLMQKKGADKPAFETISSFGKNTAEPHYSHGNTRLQKGDFALCDFGSCFRRYNSDITRTFVCGKADQKQKDMHKTVLAAQNIGFDTIRAGVQARDVHNAVSSFIDKSPFKGRFIHTTGHSLGLAVHDGPGFSPDNETTLEENMVLTVEPGVYIPGYGGVRIEDDIRVKKDGIELLTRCSRELIEL